MKPGRLAWAPALMLAACTVGPDFHPPDPGAPGDWGAVRTDVRSRTTSGEVDPQWWFSRTSRGSCC